MNRRARQLLACVLLVIGCTNDPPRVQLKTASGTRALDAWYAIYVDPLEGPGGTTAEILVALVDRSFGCRVDGGALSVDAVSFLFRMGSPTVLSRSGPIVGPTSGGTGSVTLTHVDSRFLGQDASGLKVAPGGRVDGNIDFDLGSGVSLSGNFEAPHCAVFDFRNAP